MNAPRRLLVLVLATFCCAQPLLAQVAITGAPPTLTPAQMEQFLLTAKLVSLRPVGEGVTNTRRGTFTDGQLTHDAQIQVVNESKAIFETPKGVELNFKDTYRYNVAAYRLAVYLGLNNVPMSVPRVFEGRPAAYTWWIDGFMFDEGDRIKKKEIGPDPQRYASFVHIQRVFDELIQNSDRNTGNTIWTTDWTMWMIDHTRAFRVGKDLRNPKLLERIERTMMARLRTLSAEELERTVGDSLNELEIEAVVARARLLVAFFDKRIAELGEARVLYTKR